ncbi:MAG: hypothetical protein WDN24_14985 [Sphingomonas sp.]
MSETTISVSPLAIRSMRSATAGRPAWPVRGLGGVAQQVDHRLRHQVGIGIDDEALGRERQAELHLGKLGFEQPHHLCREGRRLEAPALDHGLARHLAIAVDEARQPLRAALERGDGHARIGQLGIVDLAEQRVRGRRERRDRSERVEYLVGEDADEIGLRRHLDRVERLLHRLDDHHARLLAQPGERRRAHDRPLGAAAEVEDQHFLARRRVELEPGGEGRAVEREILGPGAAMLREQAARGLVGEVDAAVPADGEQRRGHVVDQRLEEIALVARRAALVAQPADRGVERLAQPPEARSRAAVEMDRGVAVAQRVDELRDFGIGAVDVAPQQPARARRQPRRDDAHRCQPRRDHRPAERRQRRLKQQQPPGEAEREVAVKAHVLKPSPSMGEGWVGVTFPRATSPGG